VLRQTHSTLPAVRAAALASKQSKRRQPRGLVLPPPPTHQRRVRVVTDLQDHETIQQVQAASTVRICGPRRSSGALGGWHWAASGRRGFVSASRNASAAVERRRQTPRTSHRIRSGEAAHETEFGVEASSKRVRKGGRAPERRRCGRDRAPSSVAPRSRKEILLHPALREVPSNERGRESRGVRGASRGQLVSGRVRHGAPEASVRAKMDRARERDWSSTTSRKKKTDVKLAESRSMTTMLESPGLSDGPRKPSRPKQLRQQERRRRPMGVTDRRKPPTRW